MEKSRNECVCRCNCREMEGTTKDLCLARESARARAGELNAISEYIYLSIMFEGVMPELTECFDKIAMDEMEHHRTLGELIKKLGGDPSQRAAVRNTGCIDVSEEKECRSMAAAAKSLRNNINDERQAMANYIRLGEMAQRCGQLPAAEIFRRIAEEERAHACRQEAILKLMPIH